MNNQDKQELQNMSLWGSLKQIVAGVADATTNTTMMISEASEAGRMLANTGNVLATSHNEIVKLENQGKKAEREEDIYKRFPHLKTTETAPEVFIINETGEGQT